MSSHDQDQVTTLLNLWAGGHREVENELLEVLRPHLHRSAKWLLQKNRGSELQPTELINELYIRFSVSGLPDYWDNRKHFFGFAARHMRNILVEEYRKITSLKRGGMYDLLTLEPELVPSKSSKIPLLELDEALTQLSRLYPRQVAVVEMKYFGGMTREEIAEVLDISIVTVSRDWKNSLCFLHAYMESKQGSDVRAPESKSLQIQRSDLVNH